MRKYTFLLIFAYLIMVACESKPTKQVISQKQTVATDTNTVKLPTPPKFNADSAYYYIQKQVDFGPRVPNTAAHLEAAKWMIKKFDSFQWSTHIQKTQVEAFNGVKLNIQNIVARWDTANRQRVLLFAHWDTRPFADRDTKNRNKPIDGANDGGSGVAVLMEIARAINTANQKPLIGVDIILFDAEDYGTPEQAMGVAQQGDTWCLGSQYWARNPSIPNYKPKYGILLDMVGAENAVFPKEAVSMHYAPHIVEKVWKTAAKLGYQNYFINATPPGGITDDHLYINKIAGIPAIDIIHYEPHRRDFGHFHHKHDDNMDLISKETLSAVGEVVLQVLYNEY